MLYDVAQLLSLLQGFFVSLFCVCILLLFGLVVLGVMFWGFCLGFVSVWVGLFFINK